MSWIKVREQKPPKFKPVLLFGKKYSYEPFVGKLKNKGFVDFEIDDSFIVSEITHWQPLPEPPKD
jgi:Protein of unknown function (DUF551)